MVLKIEPLTRKGLIVNNLRSSLWRSQGVGGGGKQMSNELDLRTKPFHTTLQKVGLVELTNPKKRIKEALGNWQVLPQVDHLTGL